MTHAEFNEDVVDRFLHNKGWRSEKLAVAESRGASARASDVDSSLAQESAAASSRWRELDEATDAYGSNSMKGKKQTRARRRRATSGDEKKDAR